MFSNYNSTCGPWMVGDISELSSSFVLGHVKESLYRPYMGSFLGTAIHSRAQRRVKFGICRMLLDGGTVVPNVHSKRFM